jgi:hypothetical protein
LTIWKPPIENQNSDLSVSLVSISPRQIWIAAKLEICRQNLKQKESHMTKSNDGLQLSVLHAVKSPNLPLDFV